MGKNGFVQHSERKATKVSKIVQNIQSLVLGSQRGFNQISLSITTLAKTGLQMVINDLKQLSAGISNTEQCSYKINGRMDQELELYHPAKC